MAQLDNSKGPYKVLIASANVLFGRGLSRLFQEKWGEKAVLMQLVTTMTDTLSAMDSIMPDLVILDYDDQSINREVFLAHFVRGERPMQVALISLKENGVVVVYDRRTLSSSQAEDWLNQPWLPTPRQRSEGTREE